VKEGQRTGKVPEPGIVGSFSREILRSPKHGRNTGVKGKNMKLFKNLTSFDLSFQCMDATILKKRDLRNKPMRLHGKWGFSRQPGWHGSNKHGVTST